MPSEFELQQEEVVREWSRVSKLLGTEVETPDGKGTLIGCNTPSNGLYVAWEQSTWTVWYGTAEHRISNGWVQRMYATAEVKKPTPVWEQPTLENT